MRPFGQIATCGFARRCITVDEGQSEPDARRKIAPRECIRGARGAAFEARGVYLENSRTSWGGVRKSDGVVVLGLWADAVKARDGGCLCLLWAPNVDGSHPWSDSASGQDRLRHCRLAMQGAAAEGLLVFGERLEGHAPEEKARSVYGVDPETVVRFQVEKHGEQYWAVWGKRAQQ